MKRTRFDNLSFRYDSDGDCWYVHDLTGNGDGQIGFIAWTETFSAWVFVPNHSVMNLLEKELRFIADFIHTLRPVKA